MIALKVEGNECYSLYLDAKIGYASKDCLVVTEINRVTNVKKYHEFDSLSEANECFENIMKVWALAFEQVKKDNAEVPR